MFSKASAPGSNKLPFFVLTVVLYSVSLLSPGRALAATITAVNNNDSGDGSLRAAILNASSGDTITFAPNVTGTITLTSGDLVISQGLTITGPGANVLTVSGNTSSQVFDITAGSVNISGLTVANGVATESGGGITNSGVLTVSSCTFTTNYAYGYGGGFYNTGTLNVKDSTIVNNSAVLDGGGIYNGGILTVQNDTLVQNTSQRGGAGIADFGSSLTMQNCTITGNTASDGFPDVHSASGGYGGGLSARNTVHIGSSIIANNNGNGSYHDVYGAVISDGYNLIGNNGGSTGFGATGDQVGTPTAPLNPVVGELQDNGGPTQTLALLPGSPALDHGKSALATDQRGQPRYDDPAIPNAAGGDGSDIGSYEQNPPSTLIVTNLADSGAGSLRGAIANSFPGDTIQFAPGLTGVILLTSGALTIDKGVTIAGPGADILTVSGNNSSRVFETQANSVIISGLTIMNGTSTDYGGGIDNSGDLTVNSCTIANNTAYYGGGGLYGDGSLTIANSTVFGNTAHFDGGGIYNNGTLAVLNSTVFGNSASGGGGIYDIGIFLRIACCTITGNIASGPSTGGGLISHTNTFVGSSIIAGNSDTNGGASPDVSGPVGSDGYNLVGNAAGSTGFGATGDQVGLAAAPLNPLLGPLQYNGGPTQTVALLAGSPAIDAGNDAELGAPDNLTVDQRGFARKNGAHIDTGAYELDPNALINGIGAPNLLWQNTGTGMVVFWGTNGTQITNNQQVIAGSMPAGWRIAGTPDMTNAGYPGLLWENTQTGMVVFWAMNGTTITSDQRVVVPSMPRGWIIVGTPDMTGTGYPGLLWQNTQTGMVVFWAMNGTTITGVQTVIVGSMPAGWVVVGTPDMTGSSHPGLLWENTQTGTVVFWAMSGTNITSDQRVVVGSMPQGWQVVDTNDMNADGKPDLLWENSQTGTVVFWAMNGTTVTSDQRVVVGSMPPGWFVAPDLSSGL